MSFVIIALALLCLIGLKVGIKEPLDDYISPKGTLAVKGIFVLIIFISHSIGYVTFGNGAFDFLAVKTCSALNQLMVVPFFFYSGFGIMLSAFTKKDYGKNLLKNRLLPLYLKFALAVSIYILASFVTGSKLTAPKIISGFLGWESVGNSNWFIFATFVLYIISFISLAFFKNKYVSAALCSTLTVGYIFAMIFAGKEIIWYDTVLAFPLGMWFALCKDKFDALTKKFFHWLLSLIVCGAVFLVFWYLFKITEGSAVSIMALIFKSLFFALCLVLVTRRFSPRNKILSFFGRHVFGIYIFQRLPMLLLTHYFPSINPYFFFVTSIVLTVAVAFAFEKLVQPNKFLNLLYNYTKGDKV